MRSQRNKASFTLHGVEMECSLTYQYHRMYEIELQLPSDVCLKDYIQATSSQVGKCQGDGLLGCGSMYFYIQVPTFWKNLMPGLQHSSSLNVEAACLFRIMVPKEQCYSSEDHNIKVVHFFCY